MKKIKLGITGCSGRMGQAILSEVKNFPEFVAVVGLSRHGSNDSDGSVKLTHDIEELCELSDIVIDFSSSEIISELARAVEKYRIPLVCGTTSLGDKEFKILNSASKKVPLLYSQNMSVGITVISSLLREIYLKLADKSDIEIIETHHKNKKDAPSGTAILLAERMLGKKNIEEDIIKRKTFEISTRPENKIGISSIRGGGIPGQHDILFMMANENIKISHQAMNRNIFASGALMAASWLYKQKSGWYSMEHLLQNSRI